jgi:hypothetical protein
MLLENSEPCGTSPPEFEFSMKGIIPDNPNTE